MLRGSTVALLACFAFVAAAAEDEWTTFEFESYNGEYVNIRSNAQWERDGAVQATLSSPTHRLTIRDHSVELQPAAEETYQARIRVNFSGEGDVIAELAMVGADTTLEDHVTAPQQEVEVNARLRFRQVDGGYEVETVELQESIEVQIESRLGGQIAGVCKSALAFLGVQCRGIDSMFSTATIRLPEPGATYFIPDEKLSKAEQVRLNRLLEQ